MYGADPRITPAVVTGEEDMEGSTVPSSAGALQSGSRIRRLFFSNEMALLEREVRRLQVTGAAISRLSRENLVDTADADDSKYGAL